MKCALLRWSSPQGWEVVGECPPKEDSSRLVLYFGDRRELMSHTRALDELVALFPGAQVFGCSSAGEIVGSEVTLQGISAMVMGFESSTCRHAVMQVSSSSASRSAGKSLADQLPLPGLRGVLVLSDGTFVNGTDLVSGLHEVLPPGIPLFGGLAGDGDRFESTLVGVGADLGSGRIVAIGFYGKNLDIFCGSAGGWEAFGPLRRISKSQGSVLIELDGEPALGVYKKYLGERAAELPSAALLFPLAVYTKGPDEEGVVRTILTIDEDAQTMTFAGDMPEGDEARLMHAGPDRLMLGARTAAARAFGGGKPATADAAILVSCVGRRLVLRQRAGDEVHEVLSVIGKETPAIGFYSYGEISPAQTGAVSELHNQTMTLTLFREHPAR